MIQSPKNIYLSSIRLGLIRLTRYCKLGPLFIKRRFKSEVQQGSIDGMAE